MAVNGADKARDKGWHSEKEPKMERRLSINRQFANFDGILLSGLPVSTTVLIKRIATP